MPPVSAAVITFNEEKKIADCLKSLSWTGEIVVVDSNSEDKTAEIASAHKAKVITHEWQGHVKQKNFALENVSNEWVICLDADERISRELKNEILEKLESPGSAGVDGYEMPRKVFYINRWVKHCGWYPARKLRLVKKSKAHWGGDDPHDKLIVDGNVGRLSGDIYHLSFDTVYDHFKTIDHFTQVGAEVAHRAGKRSGPIDVTIRPLFTFFKMFFLKRGFLDGWAGFILCALSAFHTFTKYDRLHEL